MPKSDRYFLSERHLFKEISKRTGVSESVVKHIFYTQYDIVKEAIANGIGVKTKLGNFTFKTVKPSKERKYYHPITKEYVTKQNIQGYSEPMFKPNKDWKKEIRELTKTEYIDENERKENG